jgi:diguanylate cyclase (GGDEF)-like protein
VTLIQAWGITAIYAHGPWFWVEMAYSYSLLILAWLILLIAIYRCPRSYSRGFRLAMVASGVPFAGSVVYAAGLDSSVHADLSSIAFAFAGLGVAWAVLRANILALAPIAWATLVDILDDAVIVLDGDGRIAAGNASADRLLGMSSSGGEERRRLESRLAELVSARDGSPGEDELELTSLQGGSEAGATSDEPPEPRWFAVRVSPLPDKQGRELGSLIVLHDVTEHRRDLERIRELSLTDELTGLLNRRGFTMLAEQQLRSAARTGNRMWLLFADLDDLKGINDRQGHDAGDRAIRDLARVLREAPFRAADIVGRIGGDEFAILATEISAANGNPLIERIRRALVRVSATPGRECHLTVSFGVAVFDPDRPQTLDGLMREADLRMYRVKHSRHAAREHGPTWRRNAVVARSGARRNEHHAA